MEEKGPTDSGQKGAYEEAVKQEAQKASRKVSTGLESKSRHETCKGNWSVGVKLKGTNSVVSTRKRSKENT